jgi:hypothetical protein
MSSFAEGWNLDQPESIAEYWVKFNEYTTKIQAMMGSTDNKNVDHITSIKSRISELQHYSTISSSILPKYDIRRCQEVLLFPFKLQMFAKVSSIIIGN